MDFKKKKEELVELFNKQQQLVQQYNKEITKLAVSQEQIKGKIQLIEEISKDEEVKVEKKDDKLTVKKEEK